MKGSVKIRNSFSFMVVLFQCHFADLRELLKTWCRLEENQPLHFIYLFILFIYRGKNERDHCLMKNLPLTLVI